MEDKARYPVAQGKSHGQSLKNGKRKQAEFPRKTSNPGAKDGGFRRTAKSSYWGSVSPGYGMPANCRNRNRHGNAVKTPENRMRDAPEPGMELGSA